MNRISIGIVVACVLASAQGAESIKPNARAKSGSSLATLQMAPASRLRGAQFADDWDWSDPNFPGWAYVQEFPDWGGNVFRFNLSPYADGKPLLLGQPLTARIAKELERFSPAIDWSLQHNIHVILRFNQSYVWPPPAADWPDDGRSLWKDQSAQDELVALWTDLATRYKGIPGIIFEPVGEPHGITPDEVADGQALPKQVWNALYQRIVNAVHSIDAERWLVIEPIWGDALSLTDLVVGDTTRLIYSFHFYSPHSFTLQTGDNSEGSGSLVYPGTNQDGPWESPMLYDKSVLRQKIQPGVDFRNKYGVRVMCGEYGAFWAAPLDSRKRWVDDAIDLCEGNGFDTLFYRYDARYGHGWNFEGTIIEGDVTSPFALNFSLPPVVSGTASVNGNPYGALSVLGATFNGNAITNFQQSTTIQLGSIGGAAGSYAEIDFQGLNLGPGYSLTIQSGASGQTAILVDTNASASSIAGRVQAQGANGAPPPMLVLKNQNGISVNAGGRISGPSGLIIDALGSTWSSGQSVVNAGTIDGGNNLELLGAKVNGGGAFKGDAIAVRTFGNANNPVNGSHFLSNGLQLFPSIGGAVQLTVNTYGSAPQFINLTVNGNATVSMPSAWPSGSTAPPNSAPLPAGAVRPAGTPEPSYGGGSIILQAAGFMTLQGGGSNDLVFPGGLVLKAGGTLNLNGVTVNQGWTTTGKPFQGIYFESPSITSPTLVSILSNDLNWTNFSTLPSAHFQISRLVAMPDGTARYSPADATAPHQNVYSILIETAAVGNCWVCLINSAPIDVH